VIDQWIAAATAGDFDRLVDELLVTHYDPTYGRSILRNFPRHADAIRVTPRAIDMAAFRALARDLDAQVNAASAVAA
jgi:tRNA 2-selenouridine synthase